VLAFLQGDEKRERKFKKLEAEMIWLVCVISTVILFYMGEISNLQCCIMLVALHFYTNINSKLDEIRRNK